MSINLIGQSPVGIWKTIDDVTGDAKSHIEIYEENGKLYGKVVKLLMSDPSTLCTECKDDLKDQPVLGMVLMKNLVPEKNYWEKGTIMDPETGKSYKCKIYMESPNKIKVRGYIGIEALGRNQYWHRV